MDHIPPKHSPRGRVCASALAAIFLASVFVSPTLSRIDVPTLWNTGLVIDSLRRWEAPVKLDRVECLWEVGMELAAEIRHAFGLPGMSRQQTRCFRDTYAMRRALEGSGLSRRRCARGWLVVRARRPRRGRVPRASPSSLAR